jgi:hypothetical protein
VTPAEIIAAVTLLNTLLTEATKLIGSLQAAHTGGTGVTTADVASSAASAAAALKQLSMDLGTPNVQV